MATSLVLEGRIENLGGLGENPVLIALGQDRETLLGVRQVLFEMTGGGREVRAPGDALGRELLDQLGKERLLPALTDIRALERMRRHLEVDVGVLREAPQWLGGIVGRTIAHVGPTQVIQ